ncbi:unnamed protein product [Mytilus edulis]|uniref:Uncharacterized protein n=1 Tax=Mytilus edulis TaxID=6550 RepID=A0A8S3QA96_MYTED|nr:unnamed protein product [Mytilus edulis]
MQSTGKSFIHSGQNLDDFVNMKKNICSELSNTCEKNPKVFWKILNKLSKQSELKDKSVNDIPQKDFIKFYKNLNKSDHDYNDHQSNVVHKFESLKANLNYSVISDEINTEINADDIVKAIRLLRNGIVIKCNGNFNLAINTLMEKARKAYFKIKKTVGLNNPCRLLEKLFDTLISPILIGEENTYQNKNLETSLTTSRKEHSSYKWEHHN